MRPRAYALTKIGCTNQRDTISTYPHTGSGEDGQAKYRPQQHEGPRWSSPGLVQQFRYPPSVQLARRSHLLRHGLIPALRYM